MKKTFDAVAWMRKRREEVDKEDQGLSFPLWQSLRERLVEPTAVPVGKTKAHKQKITVNNHV